MDKEKSKKEVQEVKEAIKNLKEIVELENVEELIKDNKLVWEYKDMRYRVRPLTHGESRKLSKFRNKKYIELLEEKDENGNFVNKPEVQLIQDLKAQGSMFTELEKEFKRLQHELKSINLKLGEALHNKEGEDIYSQYNKEVSEILIKIQENSLSRSSYLEASIERQLETELAIYMAFLVTEKLVDDKIDKWEKVWNNLEELEQAEEALVTIASTYATEIRFPTTNL